jgi:hypothetical protein
MTRFEARLRGLERHPDLVADTLNGTDDADCNKSSDQGIFYGRSSGLANCKTGQRLHSLNSQARPPQYPICHVQSIPGSY